MPISLPPRGRGTASNPHNRFAPTRSQAEDDGWFQAETAQGLDAFLRAEHAQAFFRPLPRTRMAGAAIGDGEQLQRMTEAGE